MRAFTYFIIDMACPVYEKYKYYRYRLLALSGTLCESHNSNKIWNQFQNKFEAAALFMFVKKKRTHILILMFMVYTACLP